MPRRTAPIGRASCAGFAPRQLSANLGSPVYLKQETRYNPSLLTLHRGGEKCPPLPLCTREAEKCAPLLNLQQNIVRSA